MTSHALFKCISALERIFRQDLGGRLLSASVCVFVFGYARSHWSFKTAVILFIHDVMKAYLAFSIFINPDLILIQFYPELLVYRVILVPLKARKALVKTLNSPPCARTEGRIDALASGNIHFSLSPSFQSIQRKYCVQTLSDVLYIVRQTWFRFPSFAYVLKPCSAL